MQRSQKSFPKGFSRDFKYFLSVIGKDEWDEMMPSIEVAKNIAKMLGTTVGYLFRGN